MSIEDGKEYFKRFDREEDILEFDVSSATVELAAKALNVDGARIAKTLSFMVDEHPILIVTAGDMKIDNPKYKFQFKTKAKMLSFEQAEELIGHAVGGVCPFGIKADVKVFLDVSLREYETIYPACGSGNSAIKLTPDELEKYAENFVCWIDVCAKRTVTV